MIRQLRDMFQTQARTERYDATKAFNECKMIKGTSVSDHVMKMKRHLDHLERLGHPVPLQLATDTILNSLSEDYRPFVVNYNMNNMEKTIAELHSMLKTAELNMGNKNKTKDVLMVKDGGVKKKNGHASTSKGKGPVHAIQSAPKKGKSKGKGKKEVRNEVKCPEVAEDLKIPVDLPVLQMESDFRNWKLVQVSEFMEYDKSLFFIQNPVFHSKSVRDNLSLWEHDKLLNNSYKCCRLKVAQIFDRVANIGRDPRLRLLLGICVNPRVSLIRGYPQKPNNKQGHTKGKNNSGRRNNNGGRKNSGTGGGKDSTGNKGGGRDQQSGSQRGQQHQSRWQQQQPAGSAPWGWYNQGWPIPPCPNPTQGWARPPAPPQSRQAGGLPPAVMANILRAFGQDDHVLPCVCNKVQNLVLELYFVNLHILGSSVGLIISRFKRRSK
ncbi:hypothetical protein OSB04_016204 [Centaurea solstitialis]|uniref:Uncharacterized protein n=1 Tax=Centaurea solstitialis TaxID=347529 RepID=A0AA38T238_9ASTR|nr:hypothetical protein OSB04_016204 [Centaurea solstitialis]